MKRNAASPFRHILAGLVLMISFLILSIIINLIFSSVLYIRSWLVATHRIAEIIRSLIVWIALGVFFLPFSFFKSAIISLCERVSPTRRGARYIVFATLNGLYYAFALYSCIAQKAWYDLSICAYIVILIIALTKDGLDIGAKNSAASLPKPVVKPSPPPIIDPDTGLVIESMEDVRLSNLSAEQARVDEVYKDIFRGQINPYTNRPILTESDYKEYLVQLNSERSSAKAEEARPERRSSN